MLCVERINPNSSQYESLANRLKNLPLWIQESLYYELNNNINETSGYNITSDFDNNIIQLYKPVLSKKGFICVNQKLQENTDIELDIDHKAFLTSTQKNLSMLEIAHQNIWSFIETCNILLDLIEQKLIQPVKDIKIYNYALFIAGRIHAGEFLYKTGKISTNQYRNALYALECVHTDPTNQNIIEVLLNNGDIDSDMVKSLHKVRISYRETAGVIDQVESLSEEVIYFQNEINNLLSRKKKLKEKLAFYQTELELKHSEVLELSKELSRYSNGVVGKLLLSLS